MAACPPVKAAPDKMNDALQKNRITRIEENVVAASYFPF